MLHQVLDIVAVIVTLLLVLLQLWGWWDRKKGSGRTA